MKLPDLLTAAERRLAILLFVLSAIGTGVRVGEHISPEVEAWLEEGEGPRTALVPPPSPVPRERSTADPARGGLAPSPPPPGDEPPAGRVDLNRADRAALQALPGVGPVLAERILEDRARNGPFRSVEDLRRVKGIGAKTLERIRPHVRVPGRAGANPPVRGTSAVGQPPQVGPAPREREPPPPSSPDSSADM